MMCSCLKQLLVACACEEFNRIVPLQLSTFETFDVERYSKTVDPATGVVPYSQMEKIFRVEFESVARSFSETFTELFGGGRGELKFYDITGIGQKLILKTDGKNTEWKELPADCKVLFSLLDGKIVERTQHAGQLKKITTDEAFGILETETVLSPLSDLMIMIGGQSVYAKVLKKEGNGYRIAFTEKQGSLAEILTHTSAG